jgi:hypothetical protein
MFLNERNLAPRTCFFGVGKPMFLQNELFFPFQEIKTIISGFLDQRVQLLHRQLTHFTLGMHVNAEEDFIFDNISYAGKNVLI